MTDIDLDAIEARANAASTGPWEANDDDISAHGGGLVAWIQHHGNMNTVARLGEEFSHADAAFIAHARSDVPALVAEIRRLRAGLQGGRP